MDNETFWRLIEEAKEEVDGECDAQVDLLQQKLVALSSEEIVAFDRTLDQLRDRAYRWDLWGAAVIINGGCSDDGFEYFRCWLIAQGQTIYQNALNDPDSLADVINADDDDLECEPLLYVAGYAYVEKMGVEMPAGQNTLYQSHQGPAGERWKEEELDALLPRLSAKIEGE